MLRKFKVEVVSQYIDGAYFITYIELEKGAAVDRVAEYLQMHVYPHSYVELEEVSDAS